MPAIKNKDLSLIFTSLFIIVSLNPYFVWGWMGIAFVITFAVAFFFSMQSKRIFSKNKIYPSIIIATLSFVYSMLNGASVFGATAFFSSIVLFCLLEDEYIVRLFLVFKFFLALFLMPGILLWIIHHLVNSDLLFMGSMPSELIPSKAKVDAGVGYAIYPLAVVLDYMINYQVYRMSSIFDEPGVVGTVCALVLAGSKFKLEKKRDYVIFIAGILSFSLAFYVITFMYNFFASLKSVRKMGLMVIAILALIAMSNYYGAIDNFIFSRLSIQDGSFLGDNRSDDSLEEYFSRWKNGPNSDFLFGISNYENSGASSWKEIPIKTGLLGSGVFLLIFLFLLIFNSRKINFYSWLFVAIFFASVYQRPYVIAPFFIFIFIIGIMGKSKLMANNI